MVTERWFGDRGSAGLEGVGGMAGGKGEMRASRPYAVSFALILLPLTVSVQTVYAQTRLHHLAGPNDGTQLLDVILVHGLTVLPGTDAGETWTVGPDGKETWGEWLSDGYQCNEPPPPRPLAGGVY